VGGTYGSTEYIALSFSAYTSGYFVAQLMDEYSCMRKEKRKERKEKRTKREIKKI
jgi:hypothetical protein